eukprot:6858081-Lingulodinium_polyedra.AAC.1
MQENTVCKVPRGLLAIQDLDAALSTRQFRTDKIIDRPAFLPDCETCDDNPDNATFVFFRKLRGS